ncbi:protein of unknown function [Microbacterium sp. Nx66]|nr:protein of unknown function [Microbacterium sp. Nx66]
MHSFSVGCPTERTSGRVQRGAPAHKTQNL